MTATVLLGLAIGLLLGLLGGGGSILAVPALVYGIGLPLAAAVPTSLLVVGTSSVTAVLPRLRRVRWDVVAVVTPFGALAAVGGAVLNRQLDPRVVLYGFAAVLVAAGVRMLAPQAAPGGPSVLPDGRIDRRRFLLRTAWVGLAVGFLTGLFGVGGGFVAVPALVLLLGLPMAVAVPTSLVVVAAGSAAGFLAHAGSAELDPATAGVFTLAAVTGSLLAVPLGARVPADRLRRWFAYLVFVVAAFVAARTLLGPPPS